MRLAANADVGFIRGVDQAYYRLHEQNMRKAYSALLDLRERRLVFEMVLDRYGDKVARRTGPVQRCAPQAGPGGTLGCRPCVRARAGTEQPDVDELVAFAFDCWPGVSRLPLYRTLQSRKRIGPRAMLYWSFMCPRSEGAVVAAAQVMEIPGHLA